MSAPGPVEELSASLVREFLSRKVGAQVFTGLDSLTENFTK